MLHFLCVAVVWNVISLSLYRISSFKRSSELLAGVSTCIQLVNNLKLKYNIWRTSQTDFSPYLWQNSGLHYKNITIVNDNSKVVNKWHSNLWRHSKDSRGVIYDHNILYYICHTYPKLSDKSEKCAISFFAMSGWLLARLVLFLVYVLVPPTDI